MDPADAHPYAMEAGTMNLIEPPAEIKGIAYCQPKIRELNKNDTGVALLSNVELFMNLPT